MPKYTTKDIRNIAFVGQGGAGKTTLTEALLKNAGIIGALGAVDRGDTVSDFDAQEKQYQHSLYTSIVNLNHEGTHINILDTPGLGSFVGRSVASLPAVETVAVVINGVAGIEAETRRMMKRAKNRGLCRMIVVNRIDADNVNLETLVGQIQEEFGAECLPVNLPADGRTSVIDCFWSAEGDVDFSSVADAHSAIVEQAVEMDDDLMERYLEDGDVTAEQLVGPLKLAMRDDHLVPILFTSSTTGVGVEALLNFVTKLGLNPLEGNPRPFVLGEEAVELSGERGGAPFAYVFNVRVDPFLGLLGAFRVVQGSVKKDDKLLVGSESKAFRVGHLLKLQGKKHAELDEAIPGDICALAKVEELRFGSVIHDSATSGEISLKDLPIPAPMYGQAVTAKTRSDEQKIGMALRKLAIEDPCLRVEHNSATKQTVLRGLTDHHLRLALEKMKEQYHVEVDTHQPKIEYHETILGRSEGHHRHKKQTGGAGQFGEVYLRVEPTERGEGFEFVSAIVGGVIPSQYIPAVEKGVRQALESGCVAGYPMQDIRVTIYDGKHHPVDSKEVAFVAAGKKAFKNAILEANPSILEPIVTASVTAPETYIGDITGDLAGKRGQIKGTEIAGGGGVTVKANLPLAELSNYTAGLKSMTSGQGSYTLEFSHYEPVPRDIQEKLVALYEQPEDE